MDDRRVISGIVHMLKSGGRWQDCPSEYRPSTTVYNRWNRRGVWARILAALTDEVWIAETAQIWETASVRRRSQPTEDRFSARIPHKAKISCRNSTKLLRMLARPRGIEPLFSP